MTKVTLIGKKGEKQVSIEEAGRILRYKTVNPSQTWELKENTKYIFDGQNVVKKPQKKKDDNESSPK